MNAFIGTRNKGETIMYKYSEYNSSSHWGNICIWMQHILCIQMKRSCTLPPADIIFLRSYTTVQWWHLSHFSFFFLFSRILYQQRQCLQLKIFFTTRCKKQKTRSQAKRAWTVQCIQIMYWCNLMRSYYPNGVMPETYGWNKCTFYLLSLCLPLCVPHTEEYYS